MPYREAYLILNFLDEKEVEKWCKEIDCTESELIFCGYYVGNSIVSIETFLRKNRKWIKEINLGEQ